MILLMGLIYCNNGGARCSCTLLLLTVLSATAICSKATGSHAAAVAGDGSRVYINRRTYLEHQRSTRLYHYINYNGRIRRNLVGSAPPNCGSRCAGCVPCRSVLVRIHRFSSRANNCTNLSSNNNNNNQYTIRNTSNYNAETTNYDVKREEQSGSSLMNNSISDTINDNADINPSDETSIAAAADYYPLVWRCQCHGKIYPT